MSAALIDMIQYRRLIYTKQVSDTDEYEVLVLPVHSRETRDEFRETGNLLLSGTVYNFP